MDKLDSFKVLPEVEYEIAKMLYQTGKELNCKIVSKVRVLKNQPKGFRIIFNRRENNRVLFWMEISHGALYVKANLFHINKYAERVMVCPEKIKKAITATKECRNCGLCGPHIPYYIDNVKYIPCYFRGHYFSKMDYNEWISLRDLIVLEYDNSSEFEV